MLVVHRSSRINFSQGRYFVFINHLGVFHEVFVSSLQGKLGHSHPQREFLSLDLE
jgi:hypothetical protein